MSGGTFESLHTVTNLHNDGSLGTVEDWHLESVDLPPAEESRVRISGSFEPSKGWLGLDSIRVSSSEKCLPRFVELIAKS